MDAKLFCENVKKEIKQQNATQGWIAKGIYPRVNDAIRITSSLNTSVEYLASGVVQQEGAGKSAEIIGRDLSVYEHLKTIENTVKELSERPDRPKYRRTLLP
ncbi:MAG: hypothetical protein LBD58_06770 [Treponema sp.]|jgi:hypothetical protein|nr:hypothetical protein [Treponema sp.]